MELSGAKLSSLSSLPRLLYDGTPGSPRTADSVETARQLAARAMYPIKLAFTAEHSTQVRKKLLLLFDNLSSLNLTLLLQGPDKQMVFIVQLQHEEAGF